MIVILKINSADIINEIQSDTLALCLIPSNSIKYKLSQLPIMKELINQLVDVIEEPDPIDPADYIFKNDVPEYFWKFIKYALSKPANISPINYINLCNLLLATPQKFSNNIMYNFFENTFNIFPPTTGVPITIDETGYKFQTYSRFLSPIIINSREYNIYLSAKYKTRNKTLSIESVVGYMNTNNIGNNQNRVLLYKTYSSSKTKILFIAKNSSVSGSSVTLEQDISNYDETKFIYSDIKIQHDTTTKKSTITMSTTYTPTLSSAEVTLTQTQSNIAESVFPTNNTENIGAYTNTSSGTTTTIQSVQYINSYELAIQNKNTKILEFVRYFNYDTTKKINDKLLTIV